METVRHAYFRAIEAKAARRRKLARLPILEKINIIVDMQRALNALCRATGRPVRPEWPSETAEPRRRSAGSRRFPKNCT